MKRKFSGPRKWLIQSAEEPKAFANYFRHSPALNPGTRVALYARESGRRQKPHFPPQKRSLKEDAKRHQLIVVAKIAEVAPGWDLKRPGLTKAFRLVHKGQADAVLADSVDRVIRNPDGGWPGDKDFRRLRHVAKGVTFATTMHPATPMAEVQRRQMEWGQAASGKRGGRPVSQPPGSLKRRRELRVQEARSLQQDGLSFRKISSWMAVPLTTVYEWLRN